MNIYTDGAASNNGKENAVGGWGCVILLKENDDDTIDAIELSGKQAGATNQQMELTAALEACEACLELLDIAPETLCFNIHSDSAYLVNCYLQKWWVNWQKNSWKNAKKQPVANQDIWERLIPFFENSKFNFIKVKGHSDNVYNARADKLAVAAARLGE